MRIAPAAVMTAFLLLSANGYAERAPTAPEPPPIPKNNYRPDPAPPALPAAPEVTRTTRNNGDVIEEYRLRGQLYMIKITPRNGEPYYLIDELGNREFKRSDELREPLTPPQWVLKRW